MLNPIKIYANTKINMKQVCSHLSLPLLLLLFVIARIYAEMSSVQVQDRWNKANQIADYVNKQSNRKWTAVPYKNMALLNDKERKRLTGKIR